MKIIIGAIIIALGIIFAVNYSSNQKTERACITAGLNVWDCQSYQTIYNRGNSDTQ